MWAVQKNNQGEWWGLGLGLGLGVRVRVRVVHGVFTCVFSRN